MDASYPDVMIDLETTGTDPGHAAIIQIAAVRFNYETREVGPSFVASLEMATGRFWDEDTREWWMSKWDVLEPILKVAQPADQVWRAFAAWTRQTSPALVENRLWAKPISFEWPFLQSYGRQFNDELPFHYRNAVDLNSFTRGLQNNPGALPIDKQFKLQLVGDAHNALDDCLHQVRQALSARYLINGK